MSYDLYTGLLKINQEFCKSEDASLSYNFNDDSFIILKEKYKIDVIAGNGDNLSKALNIMRWVSNHIIHDGCSKAQSENALELLEYAYNKKSGFGINCAMLSNVLARCLMSVNMHAREVKLIPYSPYDFDSHRVVQVYINELGKWIMLDPTYSSYVMNNQGNILNIAEIRLLLADQEEVVFNQEINYNGRKMESDSMFYKEYLAKNMFCLSTPDRMAFTSVKNSKLVYAYPKNFNIKQRDILCIEFKIKNGHNLNKYLEETKRESYLGISLSDLFIKPE